MTLGISIHAPREGCDQTFMSLPLETREFQSTHPARGATRLRPSASTLPRFQSTHPARGATLQTGGINLSRNISIHAPREGCDSKLY